MKVSDYRLIARESLRGKWKVAVLAGLVYSLLCGGGSAFGNIDLNFSSSSSSASSQAANSVGSTVVHPLGSGSLGIILGIAAVVFLVILLITAAFSVFAGIINTGYAKFNLDIIDGRSHPRVGTLFEYFTFWKPIAGATLLKTLLVLLWSLLFVIPGIIAAYNYAMVPYIQADNPCLPAREALARSKEMMYGNRWRLFCLQISFIGWELLSILTLGIGLLWVGPYQAASIAFFYQDISRPKPLFEEPMLKPEFM